MVLGRRRPLARAAMVGGAAYAVGKSRSAQEDESVQDESLDQGQQAPPDPTPMSESDRVEALTKLKGLLDSGVLSQEEFEAEKQKLLQSS